MIRQEDIDAARRDGYYACLEEKDGIAVMNPYTSVDEDALWEAWWDGYGDAGMDD